MATDDSNKEGSVDKANQTSAMAAAVRRTYMRTKGLKIGDQFQLDLVFPSISSREDLRHIPNDYARSSLFTARNKRTPRRALMHEQLFHYNEHVKILYTGHELRAEDDEIVWLQILKYGISVPLGQPFEFAVRDLVKDVNWTKSGRNYERVRECLSRLKANEILAQNTKAYGTSGALSLIQNYTAVNDDEGKPTKYRVWIDPDLIMLFAGNTFTNHVWTVYRDLSPVARRLADYIESHRDPFPLSIAKFQQLCGSIDSDVYSWRATVKKACLEIEKAGIAESAYLNNSQQICFVRRSGLPPPAAAATA